MKSRNRRHTVSSLRGEPLPAALNGPLPCRPPPDPLQSCLFLPSGPERKLNVSLSAASMARPSALRQLGGEKSRGGTKAGTPRPYRVKEQGHGRLTTATGASKIQGTSTCRVERDLRRLGVIG
jgi:hypothetical protein